MCIWAVNEGDRHCEYCSYRGGCERRPVLENIYSHASEYCDIMSNLVGDDIRTRKRDGLIVAGRYFVVYKLRLDGYSLMAIGQFFGMNHATVLHGANKVKDMFENPRFYWQELDIWEKFNKQLSND